MELSLHPGASARPSRPDSRHPTAAPPSRPPSPAPRLEIDNPLHLLWVWALPQMLLVMMNLRSFGLIWEEMVSSQRWMARVILGGEGVLLLASLGAALGLRAMRRRLTVLSSVWLLALPVAYLWYATAVHGFMIPRAVAEWIVRPEDWLYYQFMLAGPAVMHALLLLTRHKIGAEKWALAGLAILGGLVSLPMIADVSWRMHQAFLMMVIAPFVLVTLALVAAIMRAVIATYTWARARTVTGLTVFTVLVALALPVAGLILNASIPFPVNLQSGGVYALACLNGLVLCLPNFRSIAAHRAVWLAQAALFPFTVYFFLVFLPYVALAVPAMLIFGAGFLVLTPMALFLLHGGRLLDGLHNEMRDGSSRRPAIWLTGAVLLMPACIAGEALLERRVLGRALDFAYDANRQEHARFEGNHTLLRWSLERLHDRQAGLVLPFVSDFYSAVVFNGLSLPKEKQSFLQRFYFGEEFAPAKSGIFSRSSWDGEGTVVRPQTDLVRMTKLESGTVVEGASARTRVTVQMHNAAIVEGEFVAALQVPEGVLVSGFGLKIGEEMVPGRIFEKSTAMWVYQKIRDVVRRDPGLLVYTGPDSLELRVYPLAANETRTVEIEFLSPAAMPARLQIGGREVLAGPANVTPQAVAAELDENTTGLLLPREVLASLPAVQRTPYLHFIVDRSEAGGAWAPAQMRARMQEIARLFPEVRECVIDVANFETASVAERMPVTEIAAVPDGRLRELPARGGFVADRAIKGALLRHYAGRKSGDEAWARRVPLVVVMRGSSAEPVLEGGLEKMGFMSPDVKGYWEAPVSGEPYCRHWDGKWAEEQWRPAAVTLLKCGRALEAVAREGAPVVAFDSLGEVSVLAKEGGAWPPLQPLTRIAPTEPYSRGLAVWQESRSMGLNPSRGHEGARDLIARSRASNIMVPESSFIVVESAAQWKMLSEKERQKLSANQSLEIDAVPEPASTTMLLLGSGWLLGRRWRRRA